MTPALALLLVLRLASFPSMIASPSAVLAQAEAPPAATTPPPVLRLEGSTTAPVPAQKPAPAPPAPAAPAADVPKATAAAVGRGAPVWLTIVTNRQDAVVVREDNDAVVCAAPCNQRVPATPKDIYRIGGAGIHGSKEFDLADGIRAARLEVKAGSKGKRIAGIILTAAGGLLFLQGGLQMATWGLQQDPAIAARMGGRNFLSPTVALVLGIVGLAVGGAALGTGLYLWPSNTTKISLVPIDLPPEATAPAAPAVTPTPPPDASAPTSDAPAEAAPAPAP